MTIPAKDILFDIGATLATAIPGDTPGSIKGFALLSWAVAMLEAAQRSGARMGIIANNGELPGSSITPLLDDARLARVLDHSTVSKNRHGRVSDGDVLRKLFETTVGRCMVEGWSAAKALLSMRA